MKTGFSQGSRETFSLGTECQSASASSSSKATHLSSPQVPSGWAEGILLLARTVATETPEYWQDLAPS